LIDDYGKNGDEDNNDRNSDDDDNDVIIVYNLCLCGEDRILFNDSIHPLVEHVTS
jgi:hypothetical protein